MLGYWVVINPVLLLKWIPCWKVCTAEYGAANCFEKNAELCLRSLGGTAEWGGEEVSDGDQIFYALEQKPLVPLSLSL